MLRPLEEAAGLFGASQIIVAVVVLLVLIFRPTGLFGTAEPDLLCPGSVDFGRRSKNPASGSTAIGGETMPNWKTKLAAVAVAAMRGSRRAAGLPQEPINIAALYNISSGGLASLDGPSLNGVKLKAKMINDAGGLLDGRMIEVTAIDTKNDTREAATAAQRAVAIEGLTAGIGHSDTHFRAGLCAAVPVGGHSVRDLRRDLAGPAGHGRRRDVPRAFRRRRAGPCHGRIRL